jgi:hypothetical protein
LAIATWRLEGLGLNFGYGPPDQAWIRVGGFFVSLVYWLALGWLLAGLHVLVYPADTGPSGAMTFGQLLMLAGAFFASFVPGFMTLSALMWLLAWARRRSEPGAGALDWSVFRTSQLAIFKLGLVIVPIALGVAIIGALMPRR